MRPTVRQRIEDRRTMADERLKHQGFFARVMNRVGLFLANSVDMATAWADNDRVVFLGATAAGLARGAAYGIIAGVLAAGLLPLAPTTVIPLFFTLVTAGALGYGIYDGQHELENHLNARNSRMSDDTAKLFGAMPGRPFYPTPNVKLPPEQKSIPIQQAQEDDCDCAPVIVNRTGKPVEVTVADKDNNLKYTALVHASRADALKLDR